jgi:hypothetical protein
MSKRKPVHDEYDAVVDFFPTGDVPQFVYGLVKYTYDIADGKLARGAIEPLVHDIRDPETQPRWLPGCDFFPTKERTDVAVRGHARAAGDVPVRTSTVRLAVADRVKEIKVFGDRTVDWPRRGELRFSDPAPFVEVPMSWANAYGGWDPRVPIGKDPLTVADVSRLEFDHPGKYPRNPFGRGYIVVDQPCDALLPNLEDPAHLLTPRNLVTGDPARWHRQPMPACLDFTSPMMFHRLCWVGAEAWFHPPPGTKLPEIDLGLLPPNFEALAGSMSDSPIVMQDASYGLMFATLAAGTPLSIEGMHPILRRIRFELPRAPRIEFMIEGEVHAAEAKLTTVLIEPDHPRVSLTYVARQVEMPRVFIPGIHAKIPLAMRIDGAVKIAYDCPPTVREQRIKGQASLPPRR